MPRRHDTACTLRDAVLALAAGNLPEPRRAEVCRHLEECEPCRTAFRHATADDFPRVREYTFVERIGEGGFGIVYRAVHHAKQRTEALKVLYGQSDARAAYFENEVRLIGRLRHPNIATLYDAHLSSPPLYYCMELVEGRRLDRWLAESRAGLAERIRIVRSVASAIGYAHRQGVVHRDIKPANVMIDFSGEPRIIDFGIARKLGLTLRTREDFASPGSPAEGAVGTAGYMSPEQSSGRHVDSRSDVFSLGGLLYFCVTGRSPRHLGGGSDLQADLRELHVARAADLAAILRRCLEPDPTRRYQFAESLVADLDGYLVGRPISASQDDSLAYRARRVAAYVVRNHPLAAAAATVALSAAVLTAALWQLGSRTLAPLAPPAADVVLIGFRESTHAALRGGQLAGDLPGLDPDNRKSWRLLHGRLLERLAAAGPRVVVCDFFMPECQPDFDAAFIEGVRRVGAPVILGARQFDVNSQPVGCPHVIAAVHAVGAMHADKPGGYADRTVVALAIQRGFEPPIPSLALAALGAFRFPECSVVPAIDEPALTLRLRYRKRHSAADELRWRPETDAVPIASIDVAAGNAVTMAHDRVALGAFSLPPAGADGMPLTTNEASIVVKGMRFVPYEDVLRAGDGQLRTWFAGKAALIGEMLDERDRHTLADGRSIYGCEIQAHALRELIAGAMPVRMTRPQIVGRTVLWCLAAALLAALFPHGRVCVPLKAIASLAGLMCLGGWLLAAYTAMRVSAWPAVETGIALAGLASSGGLIFALGAARQRQVQLAPDLLPLADSDSATATVASPKNVSEPPAGSTIVLPGPLDTTPTRPV